MAVLSAQDRLDGAGEFLQGRTQERDPVVGVKADIRAAFNAMDVWMQDNAASLNAAIPLPARTALTQPQKAKLFQKVIEWRYLRNI